MVIQIKDMVMEDEEIDMMIKVEEVDGEKVIEIKVMVQMEVGGIMVEEVNQVVEDMMVDGIMIEDLVDQNLEVIQSVSFFCSFRFFLICFVSNFAILF